MPEERLGNNKGKILIGILVLAGVLFVVYKLGQKQGQPIPRSGQEESCVKTETGEEMSFSEAKEIALESECVGEGNLTDEYFCNQNTGTWWIDLDIEKEGCAPACVVNVSTGEAEINWRCTGLIPPRTEGRYVCPEDNVIDCMPIIQGEKEWFCSDDYLGWAEENCPEFIIAY